MRYRTWAGVKIREGAGVYTLDISGEHWLSIGDKAFHALFEPIPDADEPVLAGELNMARELFAALKCGDEDAARASLGKLAWDKPTPKPDAPGDTVEVKRGTVRDIVAFLDANGMHGLRLNELRAALGEKAECDHPRDKQTHDGLACCCGATRSLGEWTKPEETE